MQHKPQNILVRMPNWLGDMVMAIAFLKAVKQQYPDSKIGVIVKKGLEGLTDFLPAADEVIVFDKKEFSGISGVIRFGKMLQKGNWDVYFSLPDSISAALMGFAAGIRHRVGYKKELRSVLLTHSFVKPKKGHRVEVYLNVLKQYTGLQIQPDMKIVFENDFKEQDYFVVNINSESITSRLPFQKAKELLESLLSKLDQKIILIGSPKEVVFVESVYNSLSDNSRIINMAGKTSLRELVELVGGSKGMVTTDSGPAHLANTTGIPMLVITGAGDEKETAPFNSDQLVVKRLGKLPCEPCVKNTCKLAKLPVCLIQLDMNEIADSFVELIHSSANPN